METTTETTPCAYGCGATMSTKHAGGGVHYEYHRSRGDALVPTAAEILRADLERLAPGCDVRIHLSDAGTGQIAELTHRTTGAYAVARIGATLLTCEGEWLIQYGESPRSSISGRSAYGFDSALVYVYRHQLDFDSEHGPGTAWDYAQKAGAR